MEVVFKPSFLKDYKALPSEIRKGVKKLSLEIFPSARSFLDLEGYDMKSLRGFKNYYRIRLGDYRVGFKKEKNSIVFMRVLSRKDIYRHFP